MDPPRPDTPLQLVFHGECLDGHDPLAVRLAVVEAMKLDEPRAARLFSGRRVVLRREVGAAAAQRHIARFALMGALLRAEASTPRPPRQVSAPTKVARAARAGASWRRPLRWVAIGTLGSVVGLMLGVVLWPMLSAPWPKSNPNDTTASTPSLVANAPATLAAASATTMPAASARAASDAEEIPQDMTAEAVREYKLGYAHARGHKAFAISARGAHAWHAGANTANEASEGALASCMLARRPGDEGCRIVELDGEWRE